MLQLWKLFVKSDGHWKLFVKIQNYVLSSLNLKVVDTEIVCWKWWTLTSPSRRLWAMMGKTESSTLGQLANTNTLMVRFLWTKVFTPEINVILFSVTPKTYKRLFCGWCINTIIFWSQLSRVLSREIVQSIGVKI